MMMRHRSICHILHPRCPKIWWNDQKQIQGPSPVVTHTGEGPCICNNRNMNSNLLRVFFRRIEYKIRREQKLISQIIEKHHMKITLEDFLDWYERNKINHRNYIRINSVKKLFMSPYFNEEYTKVIRILLNNFLRNESFNCYLTSKKVSKEEARNNFLAFRTIIDNILFLKDWFLICFFSNIFIVNIIWADFPERNDWFCSAYQFFTSKKHSVCFLYVVDMMNQ